MTLLDGPSSSAAPQLKCSRRSWQSILWSYSYKKFFEKSRKFIINVFFLAN